MLNRPLHCFFAQWNILATIILKRSYNSLLLLLLCSFIPRCLLGMVQFHRYSHKDNSFNLEVRFNSCDDSYLSAADENRGITVKANWANFVGCLRKSVMPLYLEKPSVWKTIMWVSKSSMWAYLRQHYDKYHDEIKSTETTSGFCPLGFSNTVVLPKIVIGALRHWCLFQPCFTVQPCICHRVYHTRASFS